MSNNNETATLERKFTLSSLIFLNIANSIGSGIYILTGMASTLYAGQYVAVSYALAGATCFLSALCFAEFAARVKSSSGSSYTFIYGSLGEMNAFIIGWLLYIGALTSIAATSLTWSTYLDAAFNNRIKAFTTQVLHLEWDLKSPFTNYLDVPATSITIFMFIVSLRGIRLTTLFNNVLAVLNLILLAIITIGGFVFGDFSNLTKVKYTQGVEGVLKGSSVVMFAFFGFESSTFAIDETINPARTIPLSMILSLVVINVVYCGACVALNLMTPFNKIDNHAAYPTAFKNIQFMYIIVTIGK
jgi:APA family basic amino acid/polyamine antiporter